MASLNKAIIMGNLTAEPQIRSTQSGVASCTFTVAVQRRFKNAQGDYDTDFISCVAWRAQAEFLCKYFKKGQAIIVVGAIQTRTYEKEGRKIYVTEIVADEVSFGGNKKEDAPSFVEIDSDDGLPF